MSKIFEFKVPEIYCASCAFNIDEAFSELEPDDRSIIEEVDTDISDTEVIITVSDAAASRTDLPDLFEKTIVKADGRFHPKLIQREEEDDEDGPLETSKRHAWKGALGVICGSVLMGLCISSIAIPFIGMLALGILSSLLTFYLGKDSYRFAFNNLLKRKSPNMDTLFSVSTLIALTLSFASFLVPWFPRMFDTALLIFGFRHIGKVFAAEASKEIKKNLRFRSGLPKEIDTINANGELTKKLVKRLEKNDVIIIPEEAVIPVNGECLNDTVSISNQDITGNPLPEIRAKNQTILAGAKVAKGSGPLQLKVTATEQESHLYQMDRALRKARRDKAKAPLATFAKKVLKYFIPGVIALAVVSAIIIGVLFSPLSALQCAAAILVSACPCTFGLIIPLAVKIGFFKAATGGAYFSNGKALQDASEITDVVFDLHGTLTEGKPVVVANTVPVEWHSYLAALESQSEHPFARAIKATLKNQHNKELIVEKLSQDYHSGISAKINGKTYIVGNKDMMKHAGIEVSEWSHDNPAREMIYFAEEKKIKGYLLLEDPLRHDAKKTIKTFKEMGTNIHLFTGADQKVAEYFAKELGIPIKNIKANCSPSDKTSGVQHLTSLGCKVAMVGDAGNDAAAIKASTLGVAMTSSLSHQATIDAADLVIAPQAHKASLAVLVHAFKVAQKTVNQIKQNFALSLTYNLATLVIGAIFLASIGFMLNPAVGAFLMVFQAALILGNLYRFKKSVMTCANDAVMAPEKDSTQKALEHLHQPRPSVTSKNSVTLGADSITQTSASPEGNEHDQTDRCDYSISNTVQTSCSR